jgi:cleavage stimulation factor subunit 1
MFSTASSALDALQGMTGGVASRTVADQPVAKASDTSISLTPAQLEFYKAVAAQLNADGFAEEARILGMKIGSADSTPVPSSLFEMYSAQAEQARMELSERGSKQWIKLRPRPLPPIGPNEKLLDLVNYPAIPTLDEDEEEEEHMGDDMNRRDVCDELADLHRIKPPRFKTRYTAQHKQAVRSVAFSADGRLCASGSMDTSIKIMDTSKMRMFGIVTAAAAGGQQQMDELRPVIRTFYDHVGTVSTLAFHPRQPMLFTGSYDKTIKVFDLTRGGINKKAQCSITDVSAVNVVAPHPCGDYVLVGTYHPVVRLYDIHTQQCYSSYYQIHQHGGSVVDVKPASDGSVFASSSVDGNVIFWDGVSNRMINKMPQPHLGHPVHSLQWSRNNRYVLTAGGDHRARLWDMRMGKELLVYTDQPKSKCDWISAKFVQNEELIMIAATSNGVEHSPDSLVDITFLESRTGAMVVSKSGLHPGPVRCIAASPCDRTILTGCEDSKVRYIEVLQEEEGMEDE